MRVVNHERRSVSTGLVWRRAGVASRIVLVAACAVATGGAPLLSAAAWAQAVGQTPLPPLQITPPTSRLPGAGGARPGSGGQPSARPAAPADAGTPLRVTAYLYEGSPPVTRGMVWRVYAEIADSPGALRLAAESSEAQPTLRLPPGSYMIAATFGRATFSKRVMVGTVPITDNFVLNAGGLRLTASIGDRRLPEARVSYTVQLGPGAGGATIMQDVRGGRILRLPVGDYHVLSRYGDANAVMSGDVRVQPGRLTDVTIHHRAAQITLKLVSEPGGEAIANTAWSVLTPGGDTVQESIGAFPSMVLAAGDYTVIARNEGRVYNGRFTVEPGRDREVEVLAR